ncbi:MAG: hypothetical protein V2I33_22285 [Kangiellaceae bacterium]|nr:hypothetical protein [Kangiellaceae bacterium]
MVYSPIAVFIRGEETYMQPIQISGLRIYHFVVLQDNTFYAPYIETNKAWYELVFARIFESYRVLLTRAESLEEA